MTGAGEPQTLAAALEREHREIDRAVRAHLASEGAGQLAGATAALRRHIHLEEEFLFPALRRAGFVAPVFVMVREHGELWRTMEAIEAERDPAAVEALCRQLLDQLDRHNAKEEPILYPHAEAVLGAPASTELLAFLEHGQMPAGWVAQAAGGPAS